MPYFQNQLTTGACYARPVSVPVRDFLSTAEQPSLHPAQRQPHRQLAVAIGFLQVGS
jgi:hypothetical protein